MTEPTDRPPPDEPGTGPAPDVPSPPAGDDAPPDPPPAEMPVEEPAAEAPAETVSDEAAHEAGVPAPPTPARIEYDDETLSRLCEAILFVSQRPVPVSQLARTVRTTYAGVRRALKIVEARLQGHGIEIVDIAGAWQLRTAAECGPVVQKYLDAKPIRLSKAAVESLAVIAYRQPVTKPEVDEIRGVDSGSAVKLLMDRNLIKILGKKEEPGRPLLYGTTAAFLEFFGLKSLTDLPSLRDMADLTEESRRQLERDLFARAPDAAGGAGGGRRKLGGALFARAPDAAGGEGDPLSDAPRRHWDDLQEVLGTDLGDLPEGVEVIPEEGSAIEEFLWMTGGIPGIRSPEAADDAPADPEEGGDGAGDPDDRNEEGGGEGEEEP
jgi:segregation and condensation protein B